MQWRKADLVSGAWRYMPAKASGVWRCWFKANVAWANTSWGNCLQTKLFERCQFSISAPLLLEIRFQAASGMVSKNYVTGCDTNRWCISTETFQTSTESLVKVFFGSRHDKSHCSLRLSIKSVVKIKSRLSRICVQEQLKLDGTISICQKEPRRIAMYFTFPFKTWCHC